MAEWAIDTLRDGLCGKTEIATSILMPHEPIPFFPQPHRLRSPMDGSDNLESTFLSSVYMDTHRKRLLQEQTISAPYIRPSENSRDKRS